MNFEDMVKRAVNHINVNAAVSDKKSPEEMTILISESIAKAKGRSYDFTSAQSIILNQNDKKRLVKVFDEFSCENILCHCVKQILDRSFSIKYPNRNKSVRALFDIMKAIRQMSDFTIIKFDFKDYFNSVSSIYVFEKYIKDKIKTRFETDLINAFAVQTRYAYAGLCTSNVISEIIAQQFDEKIKMLFSGSGLLFFERYIDDSIIVLNKHISEDRCNEIFVQALTEVYHDAAINVGVKCKTKFNDNKFVYISHRALTNSSVRVDYLGYEFIFRLNNDKVELRCGITEAKRKKYNKRMDEIIDAYQGMGTVPSEEGDLELLRHRIAAFAQRTVYMSKHFNSSQWKVKGFIANYGELRYLTDTTIIDSVSKRFLNNMVDEAFYRAGLPLPYFIKGANGNRGYNLLENLKYNKTMLFVEHIGIDRNTLEKMCQKIGIPLTVRSNERNDSQRNKGYGELVRDYLIKTKVGY
ncbi:hypothetical protein ACS3UN_07125 [Oscillospiraceae bacterium LTW-04]|nr:hypothetical protein RBH76_03235 [Oscillospiraceae bacterium MB24-C1]